MAEGSGGEGTPADRRRKSLLDVPGMGWGRSERQPVVKRPALPWPRRSNRRGRNPSTSSSGLTARLIDASETGARWMPLCGETPRQLRRLTGADVRGVRKVEPNEDREAHQWCRSITEIG